MIFKKRQKKEIYSLMNSVIKNKNKLVKTYSNETKELPTFVNNKLIAHKLKNKNYFLKCKFNENSCEMKYYKKTEFSLEAKKIKKIAKKIKNFHGVKSSNLKEFDIIKILEVWNKETKYQLTNWESLIVNSVSEYKGEKTLCHNDLHIGNILFIRNKIKLIDYDFAGINYSIFDIVSFMSEQDMNEKNRKLFLKTYYKNKEIKIDELVLFEDFHNIFWKSWSSYMYKKTNNKDFLKINKIRNKNLKYRVYTKYKYK